MCISNFILLILILIIVISIGLSWYWSWNLKKIVTWYHMVQRIQVCRSDEKKPLWIWNACICALGIWYVIILLTLFFSAFFLSPLLRLAADRCFFFVADSLAVSLIYTAICLLYFIILWSTDLCLIILILLYPANQPVIKWKNEEYQYKTKQNKSKREKNVNKN